MLLSLLAAKRVPKQKENGKVAVLWLKILEGNPKPNLNPTILSHETAT